MDTNIYCLPEAFAFAKQGNTMRRRRNHEWAEEWRRGGFAEVDNRLRYEKWRPGGAVGLALL